MSRILITSALPYANGDLHIGHVSSTYIPADTYARFCRLRGYDVVFVCGSDDHGTPISVSAREAGRTPLEHVDYYRERQLNDLKALNISFDNYYKTHSEENREITEHFLLKLRENGYIYQKEVELFYCERDKTYLPDRMIKGTCPYCGAEDQYSDACEICGRTIEPGEIHRPYCILCGNPPVTRRENHFIFKLSAFSDRLYEWLTSNETGENFPKDVVNYVVQWIKSGLQDWDITREDYWGFKLPYADAKENQYVYVWFDAPIGYIASTINLGEKKGFNWEDYWKRDDSLITHFIGKDIVYHHFLFWPAVLMGTEEITLPRKYVVNGYLTLEGQKMSKSRNWLIPLNYILKKYPADYVRFYLAFKADNSIRDNNFGWEEFQERINGDLVDNIGNLVHRILHFINNRYDSKIPEPSDFDDLDREFIQLISSVTDELAKYYEQCDLAKAIKRIIESFKFANSYFSTKEPWKTIKKKPEEAKTTLYLCANFLCSAVIHLSPIIPQSAEKLQKYLNTEPNTWNSAKELKLKPGHEILKAEPLFEKIPKEEVDNEIETLRQQTKITERKEEIKIDEFNKLDIRIGEIVSAKQLKEDLIQITVKTEPNKQLNIVGKLGGNYKPQELKGKKVTVLTNLKPKKIQGTLSEGMLLAAIDREKISLLVPDKDVETGSKVG
ncbi:MAG: methionine--tRNA ligase [Candidatus Jordarchaeum sp.]|uniref:methionine--tRNA ligase n=1 Tax=Candidatus Jordarchaeum sp. TaxID=2823881 RepID=UPI0040492D6C